MEHPAKFGPSALSSLVPTATLLVCWSPSDHGQGLTGAGDELQQNLDWDWSPSGFFSLLPWAPVTDKTPSEEMCMCPVKCYAVMRQAI